MKTKLQNFAQRAALWIEKKKRNRWAYILIMVETNEEHSAVDTCTRTNLKADSVLNALRFASAQVEAKIKSDEAVRREAEAIAEDAARQRLKREKGLLS